MLLAALMINITGNNGVRCFVFFFILIFAHCVNSGFFLLQAWAGGKPLCTKHMCAMREVDGEFICDQCQWEKRQADKESSSSAEGRDLTQDPGTEVSELETLLKNVCFLDKSKQSNSGESGQAETVSSVQQNPLEVMPATSEIICTPMILAHGVPDTQQQPNLAAAIVMENPFTGYWDTSDESLQGEDAGAITGGAEALIIPSLASADIEVEENSCQAFQQPVQSFQESLPLEELKAILNQAGISLFPSNVHLPENECIDMLRSQWDFGPIMSQAYGIQHRGMSLAELGELLKLGKVIIRLIMTDNSIFLFHIHSIGGMGILISEYGLMTPPVETELLSTILVNAAALLPIEQTDIFLITESETDSLNQGAAPMHMSDAEVSQQNPGLDHIVITFINDQLHPEANFTPQNYQPTDIAQELVTYGNNGDIVDGIMSGYDYMPVSLFEESVQEVISNQAELQIYIQDYTGASLVISIEPDCKGMAYLSIGRQTILLDYKAIGQFIDWLMNFKLAIFRLFFKPVALIPV